MSVLVTGASGFLGTALVERLLVTGEPHVRCLVRNATKVPGLLSLQAQYPNSRLECVVGNLSSPADTQRALEGIDTIYHLAATMRGAPATMFLDTFVASKRLLEAIAKSPVRRVVLVSSMAVYGVATVRKGSVIREDTALETHPEWRDVYSHAKCRQEELFREYQRKGNFELVILRPGVLYGPGGSPLPTRLGIKVAGLLFHFGGSKILPLSYVHNCAEAIVVAGRSPESVGEVYNVVDDNLPTSRRYLKRYKAEVQRVHSITLPYSAAWLLSAALERYNAYSQFQLPAILTRYKAASLWKPFHYGNEKLKAIGWRPLVSTHDALGKTFESLRAEIDREQQPPVDVVRAAMSCRT